MKKTYKATTKSKKKFKEAVALCHKYGVEPIDCLKIKVDRYGMAEITLIRWPINGKVNDNH